MGTIMEIMTIKGRVWRRLEVTRKIITHITKGASMARPMEMVMGTHMEIMSKRTMEIYRVMELIRVIIMLRNKIFTISMEASWFLQAKTSIVMRRTPHKDSNKSLEVERKG